MKLFLCGPGLGFSNTCKYMSLETNGQFQGLWLQWWFKSFILQDLGANEQGRWETQTQRMRLDPIHQLIRFTGVGEKKQKQDGRNNLICSFLCCRTHRKMQNKLNQLAKVFLKELT